MTTGTHEYMKRVREAEERRRRQQAEAEKQRLAKQQQGYVPGFAPGVGGFVLETEPGKPKAPETPTPGFAPGVGAFVPPKESAPVVKPKPPETPTPGFAPSVGGYVPDTAAPGVKPVPDWQQYFPDTPKGEMPSRKDIVVTQLVEKGASAETIAKFIEKNPEVMESAGVSAIADKVYKAIDTGKTVKIKGKAIKPLNQPYKIEGRSITEKQYKMLQKYQDEGQHEKAFKYMVKLGIIPKGSVFMQVSKNVWSFLTSAQFKEFKEQLSKLPLYIRKAFNKGGFEAYKKAIEQHNTMLERKAKSMTEAQAKQRRKFDEKYIVIGGKAMEREIWDPIPYEYKELALKNKGGLDYMIWKMNEDYKKTERSQASYDAAIKKLEPYKIGENSYDITSFLRDNKNKKIYVDGKTRIAAVRDLKAAGFDEQAIKEAEHVAKLDSVQRLWQGMTPWKEEKGETVDIKGAIIMPAELLIPGVYTARHWSELEAPQKAFYIGMDAAFLVLPAFKAAGVAGRAAAGTGTRAAVMKAATAGTLRETGAVLAAPINVIAHPVSAAKVILKDARELAENIAHPKKLAEPVITTTKGTVRLKVGKNISEAEAKAISDAMVDLAKRGERPVVIYDGVAYELARSPLMKELKGGLAHATPQGEAFEDILKVTKKPGMPASEQGLFLAPEPLPRFTASSAFGKTGDKPLIYITSRETAEKAISTKKIYNSPVGKVAEMEAKLPVGEATAGVQQKLFTRIYPEGYKVEIWLEGKLSVPQIVKLKLLAIPESIKSALVPAMTIKGSGVLGSLTEAEVRRLVKLLKQEGFIDQARNLERARKISRYSRLGRRAAPSLYRLTKNLNRADYEREVERLRQELGYSQPKRLNFRELEKIRRAVRASKEVRVRMLRAEIPGQTIRRLPSRTELQRGRLIAGVEGSREPLRGAERTELSREGGRSRTEQPREREIPRRETPRRPPEQPPERPPGRPPHTPGTTEEPPTKIKFPEFGTKAKLKSLIKESLGAITYRRGELDGHVYHTFFVDRGGELNRVITVGAPPEGAKLATGEGSATVTLKRIRGKRLPSFKITEDTGASDTIISSDGKKLSISFTGDVVGGGRARINKPAPIKFRMPRIGGRR